MADNDTEQPEIVSIRSTIPTLPDGGDKVVLFEQDRAHPDGEVFIAGPKPVQAARTAEVERVLREGSAVVVSGKDSTGGDTGTGASAGTGRSRG